MKIILINRFFYPDHSASSQLLSDLVFHLASKGKEVHVITSRLRYDDPGIQLPVFENINSVSIHRVATSRFGRVNMLGRAFDYFTFYISAAWRLWRLARRGDVVVAKTDPPLISVAATFVCRLRRSKLVNWLQDLFPEVAQVLEVRGSNGWLGRQLVHVRNVSLRKAAMNVAIGERMGEQLIKEGIGSERIRVIHNWADGEEIKPVGSPHPNPPPQRGEGTEYLNYPPGEEGISKLEWGVEDKFVVGYSGNMGRAHEFETILKAAELLRERNDIVFLWIGGGARREWLEQEALRRGIHSFVFRSYQPRERLGESLNVPDVHLISLRPELEGLIVPSKFYGIAAAGKSAIFIGDQAGEIAKILKDNACGYVTAVGEEEVLAGYIEKLAGDQEVCHGMGHKARRVFDEKYDKSIAVQKWEEILENVSGDL